MNFERSPPDIVCGSRFGVLINRYNSLVAKTDTIKKKIAIEYILYINDDINITRNTKPEIALFNKSLLLRLQQLFGFQDIISIHIKFDITKGIIYRILFINNDRFYTILLQIYPIHMHFMQCCGRKNQHPVLFH